ncbi:ribokinase [Lewinella sp. W8]|uniref:ribokinase n=1 Tax=Lewinella sp. W8 TaxID=2528208 RepID=UPI001067E71A|nr:ribokinase [Lewinella sp. W8]MTB50824.1 ribokinase [Lewinella sp. W8]
MKRIIVVGSSNTDMVVKTDRFPRPGETIVGGEFFLFAGGKGANQAVAAARLGGRVQFVARVGEDLFGQQAIDGFMEEGIDCTFIERDPDHASGTALITVDGQGENSIVVAPGANDALLPEHLREVDFSDALVLAQLETPVPTILEAARRAAGGMILNPAPARPLPEEIYPLLLAITPNETETELLTGVAITEEPGTRDLAANKLLAKGVKHVIITLGAKGAYYSNGEESFIVPAPVVDAVDTTAAGDVFNGALVVALARNYAWREAINYAVKAASIAVTRMGAQASAPREEEL